MEDPSSTVLILCPICLGTGCNPDAPAAIADDDGTCPMCCDPRDSWYAAWHGQVRVDVLVLADPAILAELARLGGLASGDTPPNPRDSRTNHSLEATGGAGSAGSGKTQTMSTTPEGTPPDPREQVAMAWAQLREDWIEADRWAKKFGAVRELRQGETPDVRELNKFLEAVQAVRSTGALLREPLKTIAAERRRRPGPPRTK